MQFGGVQKTCPPPQLTRKDVAAILGVTVRTLSTLIRNHEKQSIAPNKEEAV
jgi:plasmid maintenance system antidote protein VapI